MAKASSAGASAPVKVKGVQIDPTSYYEITMDKFHEIPERGVRLQPGCIIEIKGSVLLLVPEEKILEVRS